MPDVIRTNSLSKSFGKSLVVSDLSIHVAEGEIFGFLGVNGAGKTTTIGMLLGMIRPSTGEISILGYKLPAGSDLWSNVGYQIGTNDSYPNLTIEENLKIVCRYRRIKESRINEIIDLLNLARYRNRKASELSLGNLQRLAIAKALIHRPKIIILDEPTNGLDPAAIVEVRKLIKSLSEDGSTVFMSSHILSEVSQLATRIAIIHDGRLIREITSTQLDGLLDKKCIVDTSNNHAALAILRARSIDAQLSNDQKIVIADQDVFQHPESISTLLVTANLPPRELRVEKEDLESFFLRSIS
jgi:ABC-2 type transport system ATP-binding protein